MHFGDAGVSPQLNVGSLLDLVDQILRHGAGERVPADKNHDAFCVPGKIHSGLAGRIRAAYDVNDLALAGQCLGGAAAVVDSRALQLVNPRSFQPSPLYSARDHQGVAGDLIAVGQFNDAVRTLSSDANRLLRRQDFHSKTPRLHHGTTGEVSSTESGGKSKIVLDSRTHSRLTARSFALDHYRVQTLGSTVNSSRQTCRTSAHNCQVVKTGFGAGPQAHFLRHFSRYAVEQFRAIREEN